jgi:SPP1 family predicted phage head-tail adaptor
MRQTVQHQSYTVTTDAYGQEVPTWNVSGPSYPAHVKPLSGKELVVAKQIKAEISHQVTLRYCGDSDPISPKDRLVYNGRILNIETVIDVDELHYAYQCLCTEVPS